MKSLLHWHNFDLPNLLPLDHSSFDACIVVVSYYFNTPPGLDIATVLVAFVTKFSPFATENSSAVATLRPVFT